MKEVNFEDAQVVTGEAMGEGLVREGATLQRAQTGFITAVSVQKPRDLDMVVKNVEREAQYAADNFFYRWRVKNKDGGTSIVEGGTIGCANAIAREWMNCGVLVDAMVQGMEWVFVARFVDLERGFTRELTWREPIPNKAVGGYTLERWRVMKYQIAQSKAVRNVIFNGVPRWLVNQAVEKAKESAHSGIDKARLDEHKKRALDWFVQNGVTKDQVISYMGKAAAEWDSDDIADLRNLSVQIKNNDVHIAEVFPKETEPVKTEPKKEEEKKPELKKVDPEKYPQPEGPKTELVYADFQPLKAKGMREKSVDPLWLELLQNSSDEVKRLWEKKHKNILEAEFVWPAAGPPPMEFEKPLESVHIETPGQEFANRDEAFAIQDWAMANGITAEELARWGEESKLVFIPEGGSFQNMRPYKRFAELIRNSPENALENFQSWKQIVSEQGQ